MATLILGRSGNWFFAEEFLLYEQMMRRVDEIAAEADDDDLAAVEVPC